MENKITLKEIKDYEKSNGAFLTLDLLILAGNLLILAGKDGFDGSVEEYNQLIGELENK